MKVDIGGWFGLLHSNKLIETALNPKTYLAVLAQ